MSHGLSRKIKKLSRFLDCGGVILRIKLKDRHYSSDDNFIRNFHEVDITKNPIISIRYYHKDWSTGKGLNLVWDFSYRSPAISLKVKNWGSNYYKDPYIDVCWRISDIRYMLVKYPDGEIKTIWI